MRLLGLCCRARLQDPSCIQRVESEKRLLVRSDGILHEKHNVRLPHERLSAFVLFVRARFSGVFI